MSQKNLTKSNPSGRGVTVSILLYLSLLILPVTGMSQVQDFRPSRQAASEAFSGNDFEEAYRHYSALLTLYPKDPLYRYLAGICLVRLQRDPILAVRHLKEAAENTGAIKPVPSDVWFWLGRAQHLAGMYDEAVASYNKYTDLAGKKSARELKVPDYLKEASEGKGRLVLPETVTEVSKPSGAPVQLKAGRPSEPEVRELVELKAEPEPAPPEVDEMLGKLLADTSRKADAALKTSEVAAVRNSSESGGKPAVNPPALRPDTTKVTREVTAPREGQTVPAADAKAGAAALKMSDSVYKPVTRKKPVYSLFEITDKPRTEKIPVNPPVPPGLIYRIQVAIFKNPVAASYFKGLTPVEGFKNPGSELTVYYAGLFRKASDASQALPKVRSHGFKDAFVVALMDGRQVSADRAAVLEKEWGSKPLFEEEVQAAPADTVPPTLVFRVELMRSQKPVPREKLEEIKSLAGDRGLDILTDEKKQSIYLIGVFLSFKSATEYSDLLIRNGYKDARVVAYLGQKEIPVEIARKLFEEF